MAKVWQACFSMLTEKVHSFIKKGQTWICGFLFRLGFDSISLK